MTDVLDWSNQASGNNATPPGGSPEGMAPSTVNDSIREIMAAVKRFQEDQGGDFHTTGGTGNAYTLTLSQSITAYTVGQRFAFEVDRANTGAATLNINGVGSRDLTKVTGSGGNQPLGAGDLQPNQVVDVVYKSADRFELVSPTSRSGGLDSGTRAFFQQTAAPTGWTKVTTGIDNRALRVTTGTVGSGGSNGFQSVFTTTRATSSDGSHNHGGTNATTLSISQIPSHRHDSPTHRTGAGTQDSAYWQDADDFPQQFLTGATGGGGSHTHSISNAGNHNHQLDLDVFFIDTIVAVKD